MDTVDIYVSWCEKALLESSASLMSSPPHPIAGSSYVLQVIRIKKSKITDVLLILNNPFSKRLQTCKYSKFHTVLKQSSTTFRSCTELGVGRRLSAFLQDVRNAQFKLICKNE